MNKSNPEVPFSLERIIKGMPEHAYAFSQEGKLLTWNKNVETLLEYSEGELRNKFVTEFVSKDDKDRVASKFIELIAEDEGKERVIEYCIETKSGKIIPCLALRSPVFVEGIKYLVGIFINISKLKNNKEKLKVNIEEIKHVKKQLQDYYSKIEKLNQSEIELKNCLILNAEAFNSKLINNMPGIFYAYEKVGEEFLLKKWNENFTVDLGYSDEELLNMEVFQFVTKNEYEKVKVGIAKVFTIGKAQVEFYTLHKSGKQIPYFYEAFPFEDKGRQYFIGIGIDISVRYALEKKQKRQEREKRRAKKALDTNKRELVATALQISKTRKIINTTHKRIDELIEKHVKTDTCNDLVAIKRDLEFQSSEQDNWEVFKLRFTEVHNDFFNNLKAKHYELTKSELKFCAYLRIHLSSSQIASILNVTKEAIKKTRYRIRKKIKLTTKDSLEDYIARF